MIDIPFAIFLASLGLMCGLAIRSDFRRRQRLAQSRLETIRSQEPRPDRSSR